MRPCLVALAVPLFLGACADDVGMRSERDDRALEAVDSLARPPLAATQSTFGPNIHRPANVIIIRPAATPAANLSSGGYVARNIGPP